MSSGPAQPLPMQIVEPTRPAPTSSDRFPDSISPSSICSISTLHRTSSRTVTVSGETITGQAEVALENREAQIATALGTTFFIAQGDTGADECAPGESTPYSILGINSGDNTASAYAVDVGGTDFMAQYNSDVNGIPISKYWNATNNPKTLASARSYIPEIPWNDGCTSRLIYSDPADWQTIQNPMALRVSVIRRWARVLSPPSPAVVDPAPALLANHRSPAWSAELVKAILNLRFKLEFRAFPATGCVTSLIFPWSPPTASGEASMWNACPTRIRAAQIAAPGTMRCFSAAGELLFPRPPWPEFRR